MIRHSDFSATDTSEVASINDEADRTDRVCFTCLVNFGWYSN